MWIVVWKKKNVKKWEWNILSVSAAFGWAIACVLRWDTCCDCSCFLFCVSALPEVNRSIAGRKVSTLARDTPLSRTPPSPHALQLNIVSAPSHAAAAGFRIKTNCVVEPNHAHHPFGGRWWLSSFRKHCRKRKAVADLRRVVRYLLSAGGSFARVCSLHRHVAVGVVHERRRVQGGCHVLVAELRGGRKGEKTE